MPARAEADPEGVKPSPKPAALGTGATPFQAGYGYASRFPIDVLPAPMRAYIRDIAVRKQVPVDLPALTMLGILGSVAGPRITIRRDLDWRQPTNLYTLCALPSGAAKSPTVDELRNGLKRARATAAEAHKKAVAARVTALGQEIETLYLTANLDSTAPDRREELRADAKKLEAEVNELTGSPPPAPELVFDGDTTPEALGISMAENGGAAAVIDDEGTFLRNLGGQYSGGKTGNLGLVLVGYDCRFYRPKRSGRIIEPIERAALSLVISPQPGIVADMMRNTTMDELGFVNRFIVSVPGELTGQRADRPSTYYQDMPQERPDRRGRDWWAALLNEVVQYDVIGDADPEDAATINLTRGAWKIHLAYEREFEIRLHPVTGDLREISAWATKHCARVLRISALLHLAAGHTCDDELSEETMSAAIKVGAWTIEHFLRAGSVVGLSEEAGQIKEYLDGLDVTYCARSDVSKAVFKNHAPAKKLTLWLAELVAAGEITIERIPTGGRPMERIHRVGSRG